MAFGTRKMAHAGSLWEQVFNKFPQIGFEVQFTWNLMVVLDQWSLLCLTGALIILLGSKIIKLLWKAEINPPKNPQKHMFCEKTMFEFAILKPYFTLPMLSVPSREASTHNYASLAALISLDQLHLWILKIRTPYKDPKYITCISTFSLKPS